MKMFKKIACIGVATTLLAMTLTACGGGSGGDDVWRIGGIGPTTGGAGLFGQSVQNGAQLAVDQINAAGGINGFQIEFNFQDDEHDAEISVNAYNSLKDWGMQILLGTVTSNPAIAVSEEAYQDNLFMLTPTATAVRAIAPPNAFRVCFSDPSQGVASARYIHETNLAERIAILYDSSDAYSTGIFETFVAEADLLGLNIVASEAFTAANRTDFSVQLQIAQNADADLLFMPFYFQEAALVLQQAYNMDFQPIFFSCDGMDGILDVDGFDATLAEGVMFLAPFAATSQDETTQAFVQAYQAEFGSLPNQFAASGYDGIFVLKAAIEHANLTPDMSVSDLTDALVATMLEITVNGVTLYQATWSADGEPDKEPLVLEIRDGIYHIIYPEEFATN
ncbi:MAG: ABC transporter substrate-binding protein [Lachnospiraceae bacterium]|nr:ABC transporter substrate-binding protein [Lachnospiraceae bacterium]